MTISSEADSNLYLPPSRCSWPDRPIEKVEKISRRPAQVLNAATFPGFVMSLTVSLPLQSSGRLIYPDNSANDPTLKTRRLPS